MNRIFHARIAWYQYFLLVVLTVNAVGALWCKYILPAVLLMLLLIALVVWGMDVCFQNFMEKIVYPH